MQGYNGKRRSVLLRGGFAALGATLTGAAIGGGSAASAAPTETVLYSFCSLPSCSDGAIPVAGLIADSSGNLYGTTAGGGAALKGVVFKLSPSGTETVLHSFTGGGPDAGLIADSKGNLYGTTFDGGTTHEGTVFKLSPGGTYAVLHSFCSLPSCGDGAFPEAGLITDSKGNLYGTTEGGGAAGRGVVFKLSTPIPPATKWTETVLYSFCSKPACGDGEFPKAGLIADSKGNLYGTTFEGGSANDGTVFKLSPGGAEMVLHSFKGSDGANPVAGLIADSSGNLYGTTLNGVTKGNGVVFKLSPGGTYTMLHTFCSLPNCSDGAFPGAGLIADSKGNLYGTTEGGGAAGNDGVVFKLSPSGTETVLHSFCSKPGCSDGIDPTAGLIADSKGNLYGTTFEGGAAGRGVVFKLAGTGFAVLLPARGP